MTRTKPRPAERPPRSVWFDPRFGIGVALVVASVAGVGAVVASADRTTRVWVARTALAPGALLGSDSLDVVSVRLGATGDRYLPASDPAEGMVVTRAIAPGEIVPMASLGSADSARLASVVIRTGQEVPGSVEAGTVVDLWSAVADEGGGFAPPSVLAASAIVARVIEQDGLMASGQGAVVELLVPRPKIALVLAAIDNAAAMSLVPVSLPVGG